MAGYETVLRHIDYLRHHLRRIGELQSHSREQVQSDWHVQFQVDRALQLAVEAVVGIAGQLISVLGLPIPDSNKDALQALVEAGILSRELGWELKRAVGFRNVIVHGYLEIDYGIVYDVLQSDVAHLEQFITQVGAFVEKQLSSAEEES
jgi:uncharacterized protein YutE (UPF0331/DUF86 family)